MSLNNCNTPLPIKVIQGFLLKSTCMYETILAFFMWKNNQGFFYQSKHPSLKSKKGLGSLGSSILADTYISLFEKFLFYISSTE
jgi:hypothetical protein